jgi:hypothetical protein
LIDRVTNEPKSSPRAIPARVGSQLCRHKDRIVRRLTESPSPAAEVVDEELRGLYHGLLVIFDGGTALAEQGLVHLIDDEGRSFDCFLHEIWFGYWPEKG